MKKNLGPVNALYPSLTTLIGAMVNGEPNFCTIAHVGIMTLEKICFGINKIHHTNIGIREQKVFSVNIPDRDLVVETDYCGLVTGKNTDKSGVFDIFYGQSEQAPMISDCPVTMECELVETIDMGSHEIFVGVSRATYADDDVLTDGAIDLAKVSPLLFDMHTRRYWALGEPVGQAWNIGKQLKRKSSE